MRKSMQIPPVLAVTKAERRWKGDGVEGACSKAMGAIATPDELRFQDVATFLLRLRQHCFLRSRPVRAFAEKKGQRFALD